MTVGGKFKNRFRRLRGSHIYKYNLVMATIVKFDEWASCIVMLTSESKKLEYIFLSVLTYGYIRRYYRQSSNFNLTRQKRDQTCT